MTTLHGMTRSSYLILAVVLTTLLGAGFAWFQTGTAETKPYPLEFDVDFSGTGLVEEVTPLAEGCRVQIALYAWLSLSQGFELADIPAQDERYFVTGTADHCTALNVAMAGASEHIAFDIGRGR